MSAASANADSPQSDGQLLLPVVAAELLAIFAYGHVLISGLLTSQVEAVLNRILAHEHTHLRLFRAELLTLGVTPPPPITNVTDAESVLIIHQIPNSLSHLRNEKDCITLLVRLEQLLEGVYYKAIPKLADPRIAQLGVETMAAEAQHDTFLNELLRPGNVEHAVPGPFLYGAG